MTVRALLWDVDGTLAETERDGHRVAFNLAFERLGLPWRWNVERYGELLAITGGRERLLHDLASQPQAPPGAAARAELAARLHALKNEIYARLVAQRRIALRPGVAALLDDCRGGGVALAIATTTSRSNVDALLGAQLGAGWQAGFAAIVCAEDAPAKKPDPLVYRLALQRLGLPAGAVLAIEDSPAGVAACAAAGVPVIVTRSIYFSGFDGAQALAAGPGLDDRRGWSGPAVVRHPIQADGAGGGRVDLQLLRRWHLVARDSSLGQLAMKR